jgi:hypothetical protein
VVTRHVSFEASAFAQSRIDGGQQPRKTARGIPFRASLFRRENEIQYAGKSRQLSTQFKEVSTANRQSTKDLPRLRW